MKTMWCRVGVRLSLTDDQYKIFMDTYKSDKQKAHALLKILLNDCSELYGETYFPSGDDVMGTDNISAEMDFNFEEGE